MDAIEKAIADFVNASAGSRLQAAMRAADQDGEPQETDAASSMMGEDGGPDPAPEPEPEPHAIPVSQVTPTLGNELMATPTELATAVHDQPRTETATTYARPTFPKAPTQSQLAVSLKLKARAMRAVLLALNEGHTPWDEFSAEHVRAYEAICDQLNTCLQTKRRDRVS
jgi:hypothetical protein